MADPFQIHGPAIVSFSGGRSSAYMLYRILQAHGGDLPAGVRVCFANTGKEMPQSLDFVRDCGERWGVDIIWLEYESAPKSADRWRRVTYETASRHGEPFKALILERNYLPNPRARFCTQDLKVNLMQRWARAQAFGDCDRVIGLRADEPQRVAKLSRQATDKQAWDIVVPLHAAGVTKRDVAAFWLRQNFDLALPNINGRTPYGNCDMCFLKPAATLSGMMRDMPQLAAWWIEMEALIPPTTGTGCHFRIDRPGYGKMWDAVQRQQSLDFGDRDELIDCICGDGA